MKLPLANPKQILMSAAALATLAACAGAVTVTGHKNISSGYRATELYVIATGDNELRTVIVGNPFGLPPEEFETAVLAAMDGRNFGPRLNLSTDPRQEDARKRRVIIAFNLPANVDGHDLCSDPAGTGETQQQLQGTLTVTGAYCADNLPLTQARAKVSNVNGAESAQFRELMGQFTLALFPSRNRRTERNHD